MPNSARAAPSARRLFAYGRQRGISRGRLAGAIGSGARGRSRGVRFIPALVRGGIAEDWLAVDSKAEGHPRARGGDLGGDGPPEAREGSSSRAGRRLGEKFLGRAADRLILARGEATWLMAHASTRRIGSSSRAGRQL